MSQNTKNQEEKEYMYFQDEDERTRHAFSVTAPETRHDDNDESVEGSNLQSSYLLDATNPNQ